MTDRYAVIGNPISHSKSPDIHRMFADQFKGQSAGDISYEALEVPLQDFEIKVFELYSKGFKGCNVTVPFKQRAFQFLHSGIAVSRPEKIEDAQAANTLIFSPPSITLENTDGIGLVRDIQNNLGITLRNKRILMIGAGGAAQGVLFPILDFLPARFVLCNRTIENTQTIQALIGRKSKYRATPFEVRSFEQLQNLQFDIVINATSAGLTDSEIPLPPGIFTPGALAYDMMYGRETPFMKFAREQGAQVADGLGMLVEQAAEAFFIWRGVRPDTAPVLAALRNL